MSKPLFPPAPVWGYCGCSDRPQPLYETPAGLLCGECADEAFPPPLYGEILRLDLGMEAETTREGVSLKGYGGPTLRTREKDGVFCPPAVIITDELPF